MSCGVGSNHMNYAMSFYDIAPGAGGCFYGDVAKGMHTSLRLRDLYYTLVP
jgi:hypothetical protein